MLSPEIVQDISEIEENCEPFIKSDEFTNFLLNSVEKIRRQVEFAISLFTNIELVTATDEDSLWHDAEVSFIAFDRVNYLMEVLQFLIVPRKKEIAEKAMKALDTIFEKTIGWLEESEFSPLRLVVLNESRRYHLEQIPEDERYRFPWYELYSDYSENTLEIIIENFDTFLSGKWEKLTREIPQEYLHEISLELKRDKLLLSRIKQEASYHKRLLAAVSKPSSLKLWRLGDEAALDYFLPGGVKKSGAVRVSLKLIEDAKIAFEADEICWKFLAAFCGPNLDDKQRLSLLDKVEERIKKIDIHKISENENILKTLKSWFEGNCDNAKLIKISFDTWIKMMEEKAINMHAVEFDESPEKLWNAIMELQKGRMGASNSVEKYINDFVNGCRQVWQIFKSTVDEPSVLYGARAIAASSEKSVQPRKLELNNNPILLSLKPNPKGEYIILSSLALKRVVLGEGVEDYEKIWNYLEHTKNDYWCGCFITNDDKPDVASVQQIENRILAKKTRDYKKAIIGVSPEKIVLEEFIQELPAVIFEGKGPLKDSLVKKVIILVISLE
ncbi:MAG: hypothetical protein EDM77_07525 [Candidatus Jettenia sp. AMX1]|nr:MAG: hypothetical protein EDM77_07525 [Candidatus Jettenia sp. AMX1]MCE7879146.1 hypothetical protein [Candidatus Jettenia sp. AMX1]MCQ3925735.1 hypothetical protein [Candidatus Jettenia sp.]